MLAQHQIEIKVYPPTGTLGFPELCVLFLPGQNNSALFWALGATQKVMIKLCGEPVEGTMFWVSDAMSQGS